MRIRPLLVVVATLVVAAASGCASNGASLASRRAEPSPMSVDAAYVARVDALARQRGVEVKWVNPPRIVDRQVASNR